MAQNSNQNSAYTRQPKERGLLLANLFTDAPITVEPEEPKKVIAAGMVAATPTKEYPDTFFGRASKVFRGEFQTLFKASLFFILFAAPFVVILAWFANYFENMVLGGTYNFMGNIGVGFPGGGDSITDAVATLIWNVQTPVIAMLALALVFGSLGLSGLMYCAKRSYFQHTYTRSIRTYWIGFAKYWWKFLVTSFVMVCIGLGMIVALMYLRQQQTLGIADAGAYCAVVFSWVFGAPMLLVPMVMMSLFTTYQLTFVQCFKNALVIIANSPVVVILTAVISAIPLALCAVQGLLSILICVVMALAGCTFMCLAWVAMGDRGMVKCHNRKVITDKTNQHEQLVAAKVARKQNATTATKTSQQKKKQPAPYQNPKKKKKK